MMLTRVRLLTTMALALAALPSVARAQDGDPHNGKFTLEEATKGLTGSGPLIATIETNKGTFTCELFADKTPLTVANFVGLARGTRAWRDPNTGTWEKNKPYYDGVIFHRVIPNFMIQGGDKAGTGTGIGSGGPSKKAPGYSFADEIVPELKFDRKGQLAMANAGPATNGSQFFITDSTPAYLNGKHTIFGQCDPASLVTTIAGVPKGARDKPVDDVVMKKVTIAYQKPGKPAKGGKKAAKK